MLPTNTKSKQTTVIKQNSHSAFLLQTHFLILIDNFVSGFSKLVASLSQFVKQWCVQPFG